jgi:hypothetical protein
LVRSVFFCGFRGHTIRHHQIEKALGPADNPGNITPGQEPQWVISLRS